MATSLSKLVDNLTDNIHNDKCIKCKSNLCHYYLNALIVKKKYEKEFNNELE